MFKRCLFLLTLLFFSVFPNVGQNQSLPARPESSPLSESIPLIQNPELKILINIPEMKLKLFEKGKLVSEHPIAVGMPKYPTPVGHYAIERIEWNPWWLPPDSDWAKDAEKTPPGPRNPLGPVKMIMDDALRIHGTNKPGSIGHAASHACIRMKNEEAKTLAWYIQSRSSMKNEEKLLEKYSKNRGTTFYVALEHPTSVEFVYEPIKVTSESIEILPDVYGKVKKLKDKILEMAQSAKIDISQIDEKKISKIKKPWKEKISIQWSDLKTDPIPESQSSLSSAKNESKNGNNSSF